MLQSLLMLRAAAIHTLTWGHQGFGMLHLSKLQLGIGSISFYLLGSVCIGLSHCQRS